jgi:peptide/nickel transport system substrate-binding protein
MEGSRTAPASITRRRLTAGLASLAVAGVALVTLAGGTPSGAAPTAGSQGTLTVAWDGQPAALDPTVGNLNTPSEQIQEEIFDTLVEEVPGSSAIVPGLATYWSRSSDALTWTFHLRTADFSNGDPVTADDVVFTIERDLNPKDAGFPAQLLSFIKSVVATNPHTVVFHLSTATAVLPEYLVLPSTGIVDSRYYKRVGANAFNARPIGSGPFSLVSNTPGQTIVLQRNVHYWRTGYPYAERVVFKYIPNDTTRMLTVESSNADIGVDVPYGQIKSLKAVRGVKLLSEPTTGIFPILLNWKMPSALASQDVRQALCYATPSSVINQVVFNGTASLSTSQMPTIKYDNPAVKPYPYDLAKAEQLMAKSPTPHGFSLNMVLVGTNTSSVQTAAILQQAWSKIGIKVHEQSVDIGTYNTDLDTAKFGALVPLPGFFDSDVPVDDEIAQIFGYASDQAAQTHYNVPSIEALIKKAVSTINEAQRKKLFYQLQQQWMLNPMNVPTVNPPAVTLLRSNVTGFGITINYYLELYAVRK